LILGQHLELRELNIFLGKNYLVTVHSQPIRTLESAESLWRGWTDLAERGTGLLAYLMIDAIVDAYMPLLDALSDRMDELEDQIFVDFQVEALEEIFRIKRKTCSSCADRSRRYAMCSIRYYVENSKSFHAKLTSTFRMSLII
jgi:Mg2+ and Co2+ transporter CorA